MAGTGECSTTSRSMVVSPDTSPSSTDIFSCHGPGPVEGHTGAVGAADAKRPAVVNGCSLLALSHQSAPGKWR